MERAEDNLTALVEIKRLTGLTVRLKPFDEIIGWVVKSPTEIVVQIRTHEVIEAKFDTFLTGRGIKLQGLSAQADGTWRAGESIVMWEDDFQKVRVAAFTPTSIADFWAKRDHENMCYRPGTSKQPMESASVTAEGYSPARMTRHWDI